MGMGYGVLTPVLKPKNFFGLAGREREKLTRRLESTGGAAAKKLKKPVFTLSHEIAALFGEQTRLARDPGCYSRRCPAQAVRRATITQITHPTDDRDDVSQNTAAVPASPRASRLASATSFEMRATRSVDGGPRFNGTVAAPGWPAAPLLPVPRDPAPTVTSCDAPATPARESVGARVSARASTRADQEGSQAGGGHRAGAPFTER